MTNKDKNNFYDLLFLNAKTTFSLYVVVMLPFVIFSNQIIKLWLGNVPPYVISFLLAISVYYLFRTIHSSLDLFYTSIGEMKYYQIIEFCMLILNIPTSYLVLFFGFPFWTVFLTMTIIEMINHISIVLLAFLKYNFPLKYFAKEVYVPFGLLSLSTIGISWTAHHLLNIAEVSMFLFLLCFVLVESFLTIAIYLFVLRKQERTAIRSTVKKYFRG